MSKKKSSIEASIVEFFTTAEPAAKQTLFNVITGLMKTQTVAAPAIAKAPRVVAKKASSAITPIAAAAASTDVAETVAEAA